MLLYLARHGAAARSGSKDSLHLTDRGRNETTQVAKALKSKKVSIDTIWHSPKKRTWETAGVWASIFKTAELVKKNGLGPDENPASFYHDELRAQNKGAILLISHQPFLEGLSELLSPGKDGISFPTSGVAAFEKTGENWNFLWSLGPRDGD